MAESALGEAFIPIRATLDKLDSDLAAARGKVDGALSKIGSSVQKVGKVALAGIAGAVVAIGGGIVAIGKQAVPAASNLNEAMNAVNVVFGDSADIIHEFGQNAADTAGLSQAAFSQMAAQTGAMLQNYGLDAQTAADETVSLGQRAADMASIFNTDVDEALAAINAGLRGEADPLEKFGVSLSAANVEAKALEMGLADATGELDAQALTTARLALLYEQTDAVAGDFVNTSDQLANASRVQAARWENFMARIGSFALPILQTFQNLFMEIGERVFPLVEAAIAPVAEVVTLLAEDFGNLIDNLLYGEEPIATISNYLAIMGEHLGLSQEQALALSTGFQDLTARIQEIISNIMLLLEPIIQSITSFVSWQDVLIALGIAIASVVLPVIGSLVVSMLPIIATVGALIGAVALLRNAWENDWGGIRTSLTAWWEETGRPLLDLLRSWLEEKIPVALETLKAFWQGVLLPAIQAVWGWLSGTLIPFLSGTVFPWLQQKIPAALQTLSNFWQNTLKPAIETVYNWISGTLIPFLSDTLFPWLQDKLTSAIQALSDYWTGTLKPALDQVWAFINDYLVPLFNVLWELFNVAGATAIEALSGLWQNTLKPALDAVWQVIQDNIIPMFEGLTRVANDELSPVLNWLSTTVLEGVTTAFENIKQAIVFVIGAVSNLIAKLKDIELPDALTPGSPTPFELGLLGINQALRDFNGQLDQLARKEQLSMEVSSNTLLGGLSGELTPAQNISYNSETVINTSQDPLRVLRASRHLDKLGEIPS